jgi:hypothetical protein
MDDLRAYTVNSFIFLDNWLPPSTIATTSAFLVISAPSKVFVDGDTDLFIILIS